MNFVLLKRDYLKSYVSKGGPNKNRTQLRGIDQLLEN